METGDLALPTEAPRRAPYVVVGVLGSLAFLAISFAPQVTIEKYRVSYLSLIPILWAVYFLRRVFLIQPLHYALFAVALVIHDLGAFGCYARFVWGLQFDWCVHFWFGLVGGLMFANWLRLKVGVRGGKLALLTVLCVGGVSSLHEIGEVGTNIFFGDYGMAYYGPDNPFDAQEDMLAGNLGALLAATLGWLHARRKSASAAQ